MEKFITDFNFSLFLWQTFILGLLCAIIYLLVKLYKKVMQNLENKSKAPRSADLQSVPTNEREK